MHEGYFEQGMDISEKGLLILKIYRHIGLDKRRNDDIHDANNKPVPRGCKLELTFPARKQTRWKCGCTDQRTMSERLVGHSVDPATVVYCLEDGDYLHQENCGRRAELYFRTVNQMVAKLSTHKQLMRGYQKMFSKMKRLTQLKNHIMRMELRQWYSPPQDNPQVEVEETRTAEEQEFQQRTTRMEVLGHKAHKETQEKQKQQRKVAISILNLEDSKDPRRFFAIRLDKEHEMFKSMGFKPGQKSN